MSKWKYIIAYAQYFVYCSIKASANKNAFLYLHFKHPNILHISDELLRSIFFWSLSPSRRPTWKSQFDPSTLGTWRNKNPGSVVIPSIPWKIHGITPESWRNSDEMSPWQNSDEKYVWNPSRFRWFCRDSIAILSCFQCYQCARAELTFSTRTSWGW